MNEFKQHVFVTRKKLQDNILWTLRTIKFESNSVHDTPTGIYPMAPFLSPGEQTLWDNIETKGIFNKNVKWLDSITNYRICKYDYEKHIGNFVLIPSIDDVVVTNSHRISDSDRYGSYVKSPYTTTGYGNTKTTSKTVGNMSVFAGGKPYIVFRNIMDPNGVSKLIKSVKKQCGFTLDLNQSIIIDKASFSLSERREEYLFLPNNADQNNSNNKRKVQCFKCNHSMKQIPNFVTNAVLN